MRTRRKHSVVSRKTSARIRHSRLVRFAGTCALYFVREARAGRKVLIATLLDAGRLIRASTLLQITRTVRYGFSTPSPPNPPLRQRSGQALEGRACGRSCARRLAAGCEGCVSPGFGHGLG